MRERTRRISELIKTEISNIALRDLGEHAGFFTILAVDTDGDLKHAIIWYSYIGDDLDVLQEELKRKVGYIQHTLNKRLSLKYVPKISFRYDKSAEYAQEISHLFEEIKNEER
jgi:ribosome-binding factor A